MYSDKATDYSISVEDASELLGVVLLPHEFRAMALKRYFDLYGVDAMLNLFSQFIGLSNSVVANVQESVIEFQVIHADVHPYEAEKVNFPTIFGALNGVKLAHGVDQSATCHGCACRLGSLANQSPSTTCDVEWCLAGDDAFYCHENFDENNMPTRRCVGAQVHRKNSDI